MSEWKKKIKRLFVLAMTVVLVGTSMDLSGFTVAAEEAQVQENVSDGDAGSTDETLDDVGVYDSELLAMTYVSDVELPSNEELFAGYVDKTFYGEFSVFGLSAGNRLSGASKTLYDILKSGIEEIAAGNQASTVISVDIEDLSIQSSYTAADLGVDSLVVNGAIPEAVREALGNAFWSQLDVSAVNNALLHDCPYDLYWYDKSTLGGLSYGASMTTDGTLITMVGPLTFAFSVAGAYRADDYDADTPAVNTNLTSATATAKANADAIVTASAGKTDYEKIVAYKEAICDLVSYNDDAAESGWDSSAQNDPWQMIYVFDGDVNTDVVCEGYSKAFQYLCDMSTFTDAVCYTVSGYMQGGTGAGGHMWNIVTMEDGKNYLVDVTNSDTGSVGQDGGLFLAGTTGSITGGYTFTAGYSNVTFTYYADTISMWGDGTDSILNLSTTDYEPPQPYMPTTLRVGDVVVINGGVLQSTTSGTGWIYDASTNTLTLSGGTITGTDYGIYVDGDLDIQVTGDASVVSTDGYGIFSTETSKLKIAIEDDAELEVIGVTADSYEGDNYDGILCSGDLEISGGKLEASAFIGIYATGNLNILDTTIYATGFNKGIASGGRFIIAGSIINAIARDEDCSGIGGIPAATDSILMDNNSDMTVAGDVTLKESITLAEDGSLTLDDGATLTIPNGVTLDITKIGSASLGTGASVIVQDGGTLLCGHPDMNDDYVCSICRGEYVATVQVGDVVTYYKTFEDAIASATDGAVVTLLKSISLSTDATTSIDIENNITIDLNEKTLDIGGRNLYITAGYDVTIQDGTITGNHLNCTITNVGTLLLKNVEVSNTNTGNSRPLSSQADLILDGGVINGSLYPTGTLTLVNSPEITGNLQFYLAVSNCDLDIIIGSDLDKTNMEPLGFGAADNVITCSNGVTLDPEWFENAHASQFVLVHDSENNSMGVRLNIAITTIEQNELTYTGSEVSNIFKITKNADTLAEGTDFTVTVNGSQKAINAGEYTATITGIGRWYAGTVTKTFTISKVEINSVDISVEEPQAEQMPQSNVEVPANGGYTGTISWEPAVAEDKFDYNTVYTATVVLTADSNHKFTENTTAEGFDSAVASADGSTLTLKKTFATTEKIPVGLAVIPSGQFAIYYATAEEAMANLDKTIGYYNGSLGIIGEFDITWSLVGTFDSAFDAENTYKYVIDDADAANYDFGNVTEGTVKFQNASGLAVTNTASDKEITYDGKTFDVSSLFTIDANAGAATYSVLDLESTGAGILNGTELTITKAGEILILLSTEANGIYLPSIEVAALTVNKAEGICTVSVEDITYHEAPLDVKINSTTNPTYSVMYTGLDYNSDIEPVEAGDYTVTVTFAETDLYKETIVTDTFTIKKSIPVLTGVKSVNTLYESTLVSEVVLTADNMYSGTLVLDGVTELTVGTKEYTYKFTPDDTKNYESVTGKVSLTVLENALVSIVTSVNPNKINYTYGEEFDLTGAIVIATYADGSYKDVTNFVTYDKALVAGQTEVVLTYQGKSCVVSGIIVDKVRLDISNVLWGTNLYIYDGKEKSIELTGEIPEGVVVTLSGNKATNAGRYNAKAEFSFAEGYSADNYELWPVSYMESVWWIEPKEINENNTVYVLGDSLTYNGTEQTQTLQSVKVDGLDVTYELIANKATDAGAYTMAINCNGNFMGSIMIPWSIAQKNISDANITLDGELTYNGTEQTQNVSNVTVDGIQLTVYDYAISDNKATNAGEYLLTLTADANSNFTGNATANWSIGKVDISQVEITINDTIMYNGEVQIVDYTIGKVNGLTPTYDVSGVSATNAGTYHLEVVGNGNFMGTATKAWSISPVDISSAQVVLGVELTYNGKEQTQTIQSVMASDIALSVTDYDVTGNVAKDVGAYELTITGKGNFSGNVTKAYSVAKASAPVIEDVVKYYTYSAGSNGAMVNVDLAVLLPADFAATSYALAANDANYVVEEAVSTDGKLTYKVGNTGNIGDTTTLTVTAESKNYANATINVIIKLTDKLITVLKNGSEVSVIGGNTLTYGQKVSDMSFDTTKAVFVAEGTDTVVEGTLSWVTPDTVNNAGQATAQWKFTPNDTTSYTELTGSLNLTVNKAVPTVALPAVEVFTYHPEKTLSDIMLVGNNGYHTVAGTRVDVDGNWKFKNENLVPVVNNEGYVVVFTPVDTTNYEIVEKTVAVQVTKATPSIDVKPEAATIIYGKTLADASLANGKAAYEAGSTIDVAGSFAWKDTTIVPTVLNSNFTEYDVVFTPEDTDNYNNAYCKLTLTVNKAPKAPNMPEETRNVTNEIDQVSKVTLPENWSWVSEDADKELNVGEAETAVARYVGSDAGNYVVETVTVTITRASAPKQPDVTTAPNDVPFIYGNRSLFGWDVINDRFAKAELNTTINVDMNGSKVIPAMVQNTLKDRNITGTFHMYDGISWTINGLSIQNTSDLNFGMKLNQSNIPNDVKEKLTSGRGYLTFSTEHSGDLGLKAILNVRIQPESGFKGFVEIGTGWDVEGKYANLFYYNEEYDKMQFVCADESDQYGMVHLPLYHFSEYIIVVDDNILNDTYTSPQTGEDMSMNYWWFVTIAVLAVGSGYVVIKKKRR